MMVDGERRAGLPIVGNEQFVTVREGMVGLSDKQTENSVIAIKRFVFRAGVPLKPSAIAVCQLRGEAAKTTKYYALVHAPGEYYCRPMQNEMSVMGLRLLPAANGRIQSAIKEGDYDFRGIALPLDADTVFLIDGEQGYHHGLGEIVFLTSKGLFQIVPTRMTDVADLCARR